MALRVLSALAAAAAAAAFLPSQNPPWAPRYAMNESTLQMAVNASGWYNATIAAGFGVSSFDWSNAKAQWAVSRPMDCEERLVEQARMTKAVNPSGKVFVYRNLVKALPWFSTVRQKLVDPAYAGWFLRFSGKGDYNVPACDTNYDPPLCSALYHDQLQTPEVPSPSNPSPDGSCVGTCDCGAVPCGEYLFDHRNGSALRNWLLEEVIGGPNGVGNPLIDGLFIDDFWCANAINGSGACTDPVQGPTEIDPHNQADMGLSDADVAALTAGWLETMTAAQEYILGAGAYTWSLIPGQDNANAAPRLLDQRSCAAFLLPACSGGAPSPWETQPLLMGLTPGNASTPLPQSAQDVAAFLLMRGPHAWLGWGAWGMEWPVGTPDFSNHSQPLVPIPAQLGADYGEPAGACAQTVPGVFAREWSKASVRLDCNTFTASITPHEEGL